jgi:carbon-monoxide dehydrogenase large subunit
MRFRILADIGAYFLNATSGPPVNAAHRVAGPYAIPVMDVECVSVLTNKPSTGPYRGAGGPEGAYFMERTIDLIARQLVLDPAAVRRRNFIKPDAFPYTTATGLTYDSGDFQGALERALELADYTSVRQTQKQRTATQPLLGIGLAAVVKASGGRGEMKNSQALVRIQPDGQVQVYTEVSPHGQGTATTFAQIAADTLGIRPEDVQVLHGDTTLLPSGQGTFASRGLTVGGSAVYAGLQQARQAMARLASHLLDCWVEDVVFQEGTVLNARNPTQVMTFADVAAAAQQRHELPPELAAGLEFPVTFSLRDNPYGFGVHVAVVEVDRDTGALQVRRYVAVHDCGRVINPKLLEGQVYGAIAQGLGQALGEGMLYSEEGQPLTGSLLDYPLPHARDMLEIRVDTMPTLSPTNALGLKGIGELPTVACPVALVNAAIDALSGANTMHLDAPLTTEKLWRALHGSVS